MRYAVSRALVRVSALCLVGMAVDPLPAQDENPLPDQTSDQRPLNSQWQLETIELKTGNVYQGLVLSQTEHELDFVEITRPRGKPMYLVRLSLDPRSVGRVERIEVRQQQELYQRIEPLLQFKSRALIEAGRMEDVTLEPADGPNRPAWSYNGPWFRLESTTDETQTRRCVVRMEQIFRAFQHVAPPRAKPRQRLTVKLFGSMDEYQKALRDLQLDIENPAFFSARDNTIVAGSELTAFARQLANVRRQNDRTRNEYDAIDREMPAQLAALSESLKRNGFTPEEIQQELRARNAAWRKTCEAMLRKLEATDRRNEAKFSELTKQMFTRLYHESFHAYLENYVYPQQLFSVPRWLNEGLAQIFETSQLDEDTLRIDLPDPAKLIRLQEDLQGGNPLSIADVIQAEDASFLVTHSSGSSERHYLYSWGLAHYLTFYDDLLYSNTLDEYVIQDDSIPSQIARFNKLTGLPLQQFEQRWRSTMLQARSPGR